MPTCPPARCPATPQPAGFRVINGAATSGGCASIAGGSPTISGCHFQGCQAASPTGRGGALYVSGPSAHPLLLNTSFLSNYAGLYGGGVYVYQGSIAIQGCTFDNNTASPGIGMGGAAMFDSTQLTSVTDTTMARGGFGQGQQLPECSAQYEHYAQCCCGGHTSSSLPSRPTLCSLPTGPCLPPGAGNVGFSGGAISAQLAGDVRLTRVRLIDNYSASFAGAALVWGSNLTIIDSDVSNVSVPMGVGGSFRCQNKQSEYSRSRAGHSAPVEAVSAPRLCPALLSCRPAGLLPPPPALCPRPPPRRRTSPPYLVAASTPSTRCTMPPTPDTPTTRRCGAAAAA